MSNINFRNSDRASLDLFFRGQPYSNGYDQRLSFLEIKADFYGFYAKDFLTYNRESILPTARKKAYKALSSAVIRYIEKNFETLDHLQKPYAAAFYILNCNKKFDKIESIFIKALDDIELSISNHPPENLKNILSKIRSGKIPSLSTSGSETTKETETDYLDNNKQASQRILYLIKFILGKENFFYTTEKIKNDQTGNRYRWSSEDKQPVSNDILKQILIQKSTTREIGCRYLFPCWSHFRKLAIRAKINWANHYRHEGYINDFLVLPCFFNNKRGQPVVFDHSDELAEWVFENRKNKDVTLAEIKELHKSLIEHLEKIMQEEDSTGATDNPS